MERKVSARKVKKMGIVREIKPLFSAVTMEERIPDKWYTITVRLNLLAKILTVLSFPIAVVVNGASEAFADMMGDLKTGFPIDYYFGDGNKHLAEVKKLYDNAK